MYLNINRFVKPTRPCVRVARSELWASERRNFCWLFSESSYLPLPTIYSYATFSIMHLICPPKVYIAFVFHFSWVLQPSQEKLKTMLMQTFFFLGGGVGIRCIMGNVKEILTVQSWQVRVYTGTKKREYYSLLPITRSLATSKKLLFPFGSFPCNFTLDNSNPVLSAWQVGK